MADITAIASFPGSNSILVLDLTTQSILATLTAGNLHPRSHSGSPRASQAYATDDGALTGLVYPVNLPAYTSGTTISVDPQPTEITATPDGTYVFVASVSTGTITPIATPSNVAGTGIILPERRTSTG